MEPEVHIVERYFQEVKLCTMTNTRCKGGKREEKGLTPEHYKSWETS